MNFNFYTFKQTQLLAIAKGKRERQKNELKLCKRAIREGEKRELENHKKIRKYNRETRGCKFCYILFFVLKRIYAK